MAPPLIQLKDISLTFGGTPLLAGVELSVSRVRAGLPDRPQRLRQIDPAQDRRRPRRARQGQPLRAARRHHPLSAAGAGLSAASPPRWPMSRPASAPATTITRRNTCWSSSACTATRIPRICPAAKRAAPRWRGCWRPRPTSCCWTSRPTISISPPSNGWKAISPAAAARWSSSAMTAASCPTCRASTAWLDRGQIRQIDRGFAAFEAWRDEVLAEEEREQHKLDRKIVAEEHWLRYGVSGRRKRNVKRLGNLFALREQRRDYRGAAGNANLDRGRSRKIRQADHRGQGHQPQLWRPQDRRRLLDPHPARRPHRHRRAERRRQDHADRHADRRQSAGQRQHPVRRQHRDGDARPASRKPRSEIDAGRSPDRRPRRPCHGRRQAEARGQLHEGLPVRRRSRCARRWKCCRAASAAG